MSRLLLVTALLVTASVSSVFGQDARWSAGMLNGYAWTQMDDGARSYYMLGVIETSNTLEADDPRRLVDLEKCRCNALDIIQGVTTFYAAATGENQRWMRLPMLTVIVGEYNKRSGKPLEAIAAVYSMMLSEIDKMEHPRKP